MTVEIKAYENGPLVVNGTLRYRREDGSVVVADSAALCRCGQSGKGVFCDGRHQQVDFRARGFDLTIEAVEKSESAEEQTP